MRRPSIFVPESSGWTRIPRSLGDSTEFAGGPDGPLFEADPLRGDIWGYW
jgi:hypothetical protein